MKMEQTECSETSAYKIQTPGNENVQHAEHGESLKSRRHKPNNHKTHQPVNVAKALGFAACMYVDCCVSFEHVHNVFV